jgi:hypothetical protein
MNKNEEGVNSEPEDEHAPVYCDVTPCSLMEIFRRFGIRVEY